MRYEYYNLFKFNFSGITPLMISLLFVFTAFFSASAQSVRINEFMAVNSSTLADKDGNYSDWIELYNSTTLDINLQGWSLTDNVADPRKFDLVFPQLDLGPLSAIDQEQMVLNFQYLGSWIGQGPWRGGIATEDMKFHI